MVQVPRSPPNRRQGTWIALTTLGSESGCSSTWKPICLANAERRWRMRKGGLYETCSGSTRKLVPSLT